MFQQFPSALFFLPLAYFVPPSIALVHAEFNTLFQFWIHTEVIKDICPLEYILNSPKHHRVHHGSNRYCLDKNYAGALIIWDRMFGTFAEERNDEKIVYGLVDQPQFFYPIKHQLFYFHNVFKKARGMDNWKDYVGAFVNGPGWFPGTPRLGDPKGVPKIPSRKIYDPKIPLWANMYVLVHFIICILGIEGMARMSGMSQIGIFGIGIYFIYEGEVIQRYLAGRTDFYQYNEGITEFPTILTIFQSPPTNLSMGKDFNVSLSLTDMLANPTVLTIGKNHIQAKTRLKEL